jgi:hypothetical protein
MPELRDLCHRSVRASIPRLIDIGTWPRPPIGRRLHLGRDFYINQIDDIEEVQGLIEYLASDERLRTIYVGDSGQSPNHVFGNIGYNY